MQRQAAVAAYGKLPLSFEPNRGQAGQPADFVSRGQGYTLLLSPSSSTLALHQARSTEHRDRMEPGASAGAPPVSLQVRLVGANASAAAVPEEPLPGKSNYFIGNDRSKWHTDIANYGCVRYRSIYPGIDVVYYGNQRLLEHDFEVAPGADPRRIRLAFDGMKSAEVDASGDLVLRLARGEVRLRKPVIYQKNEAGRQEIAGGFVVSKKNEVGIRIGEYDRRRTLVIDPVLSYATYLGGTGEEIGWGVATDSIGNVYVVGTTASTDFLSPATHGVTGATSGCAFGTTGCSGAFDDVFIVKINPNGTGGTSGTALVYSTYLGGNGDDEGYGISVDSVGNAYLTGFTQSTNFPTSSSPAPYQATLGSNEGNAFVTKLGAAGNTLLYSTYLGGHARDWGEAITQDAGGNIYVTGHSFSRDLPTIAELSPPPQTIYASANSATSWTAGIGANSLVTNAIVVDKNTPGTVYAGQVGSGVYKSTDSGATWTATASSPGYANALVIDPTTTGAAAVLYEGDRFNGVVRISGGGTSQTFINSGLTNFNVLSLVLDPANSAILYAGTNGSGVWMTTSANGSATWTQVTTTGLGNQTIHALAIDPITRVLYAGTDTGVYQFTIGGVSWSQTAGGPTGTVLSLAIDSGSNVYAATFGSGLHKLSGGAWTRVNGSGGSALGTLNLRAVVVDPVVPQIIYAGGRVGVYRSGDGGANWAPVNSGLTVDSVQTLAIDPVTDSKIYAGMVNLMSFVAKFNSGGVPTVLAHFGGGSGSTQAYSIAVDNATSQNMFIAGITSSAAMPAPLVGQTTLGGNTDGFIAKIGTVSTPSVVWDRYLGGAFDDIIYSLALDSNGNEWVTGYTTSANYPVTGNAYQSALNGAANGASDAIVAEIDPTGATLLYSTYFGGSGDDEGTGIATVPVHSVMNVGVVAAGAGYTAPTVTISGGGGSGATATANLSTGQITSYTVTNGGSGYVQPPTVTVTDPTGTGAQAQPIMSPPVTSVSIAGDTDSTDLPTANPVQSVNGGVWNTYYAKFDPSQSGAAALQFSTYIGGNYYDYASLNNLALDPLGAAWISGQAYSSNFPTTGNAVQGTASSTVRNTGDAFLYRLGTNGKASDVSLAITTSTTVCPTAGSLSIVPEGKVFAYCISVSNNGPNPAGAPNVSVRGTVPSNLTVNSVISAGATCSTGQTFTCAYSNPLPVGNGVAGITVSVTANTLTAPPSSAALAFIARITTADDDPVPSNNSGSSSITVQRQADLAITNLSAPTSVGTGNSFSYSITAANNGPNTATGVVVTYNVPANVTFNAASSSVVCAQAGSTVTCSVGSMAPNATVTVGINVTPNAVGPLSASFTVSSTQVVDDGPSGGPGANNSVTTSATVSTSVDLSLTGPTSLSVPVGGSAALAYTVHNNSTTDTANAPTVTVSLPAGVAYASFSSPTTGVSCNGAVTCSLPNLAPGASIVVTVFVRSLVQGSYSTNASVAFSGTDPVSSNNSATTSLTFTGGVGSTLATVLTDYETNSLQVYSGYPFPGPLCCTGAVAVGASPSIVVIAPNGRLAFVADINASYLSVIDLTIGAEVTRIRNLRAWSMALTSDGTKLVSIGYNADELDIIDIATLGITRISMDGRVGDAAGVADIHPFSLALVGNVAYIANEFGAVITVNFTNPASPVFGTIAGTAAFSQLHAGHQVAATPDGSTVVVYGRPKAGGNSVAYLINASTKTLSQTVATTFTNATSIAITPNPNAATGLVAFLGHGGRISVLDLRNGSATYGQILAGTGAPLAGTVQDIAVTPDGVTVQAIRGVGQGSAGPPSTLYTLDANLLVTNPAASVLSTVTIPNSISMRGLAIGYVQSAPPAGAPQVFDVEPREITNEVAKAVTVFGDNFAPGALVRIGNLEPLLSTFASRQQITVTVPAGAAVQVGTIVVTLPNSAAGALAANVSGGGQQSGRPLRISPPASFAPPHPAVVTGYGNTLSLLFRDSVSQPQSAFSPNLAVSPDGLYAYSGIFELGVTNLDTSQIQLNQGPNVAFANCGTATTDGYTVATDPVTLKKVLYLVSCDATNFTNDTLYVLDVDPTSTTTRNTVLRTITAAPTDLYEAQSIATTPDGRYVYSPDLFGNGTTTRLVIFDTLNGTSTVVPDITTLGADVNQVHIQVTPDGKSLLMSGTGNTSIKIYDITNPLNPVLTGTITGSGAPTTNPPLFYWFQVVGTTSPRLFAYASDQRYVQVLDFNSRTPLGSYTIPSVPGTFAGSAMAVNPEGTLIYAVLESEDTVAVLDANLVAASSANALITKMRTPVNPANVAISTRTKASADLQVAMDSTLNFDGASNTAFAALNKPYDVLLEVTNSGPSTATGVNLTMTIPSGTTVNSAVIVDSSGNANFSCTPSGGQLVCPVGSLDVYGFVTVDVNATSTTLGTFAVTAAVVSGPLGGPPNELDPNPANNSQTVNLAVQNGADLAITGTVPVAVPGIPATFTAVVTNKGPDVATAVNVSLATTAGILPTSITTSKGTCTVNTSSCTLGDIPVNGSVNLTLTATFTANNLFPNSTFFDGFVYSSTADPDNRNNTFLLPVPFTNPATPQQRWLIADRTTGLTTILDPATNTQLGQGIASGVSPNAIAVSPTNRHIVFVANLNSTYISVVDTSIQQEIYRIRTNLANFRDVAFTPDGTRVVAMLSSEDLLIIDAVTFQILQDVKLSPVFPDVVAPAALTSLAVTGHKAYVAANGSAIIAVIDLNNFAVSTVSGVVGVGPSAVGNSTMAATPDGNYVLAVRVGSPNALQIISTASNAVQQTVSLSIGSAFKVAVGTSSSAAPVGTYAYVGGSTINVVDMTLGSPTFGQALAGKTAAISFSPQEMKVAPDGTRLYGIVNASATGVTNAVAVNTATLVSSGGGLIFSGRLGGGCVSSSICPASLRGLAAAYVDTLSESGAPAITGVNPNFVFNDVTNTITISGSGFALDARVRVGTMDGQAGNPAAGVLQVTFVSANTLQVTLPKGAPAHGSNIIVTNPNTTAAPAGQLLSATLQGGTDVGGFEIGIPVSFQSKFQPFVTDFGAGVIDRLQQNGGGSGQSFVGTDPFGIAFSPDGSEFYIESLNLASIVAGPTDFSNFGNLQNTQIPLGGVPGQPDSIAVVNSPDNGRPVAYVTSQRTTAPGDVQLNVIDADPLSTSFNSILYTIPAQHGSAALPTAMAVTPDGRFVYQLVNTNGELVIFNVTGRSATDLAAGALGNIGWTSAVVTPDGRSLLLPDDATGGVSIFDISANALAPSFVATISPSPVPGITSLYFDGFRLMGTHLYAVDSANKVLEIFNFNQSTRGSSFVNYFKAPGAPPTAVGFVSAFAVAPDESLVYLPVREDDMVAVIDAQKLISGGVQDDPTALVTTIATAAGPSTVALSPKRLDTAPDDVAISITHSPDPVAPGDSVTFTVTLTEFGPFQGGGNNGDNSHGGFLVNLDPSLTLVSSSFQTMSFVSCGLNGTQFLCGFTGNGGPSGPPPQSITGNIVVRTSSTGSKTVTGYIEAGNNTYDPNLANNTATDTVAVAGSAIVLSVTTNGAGSGTITSNPAGISCPGTCTFAFAAGTSVTLTPAASAGSAFAAWGGACSGAGACSVTLNSPQSVSATFNLTTVTVIGAGAGNGTVTGTGGISCTSTAGVTSGVCTNTSPLNADDTVTLTATAASSLYLFDGWSGPCSGTGACTFTLGTSPTTATASFSVNTGVAPTLVADYQFASVYTSSAGSPPALVDIGAGANAFAAETVRGVSQTVLVFPTGNGLQLSPTSGLLANNFYTVAALVRLDAISGYRRILDFKNASSDDGLYNLNGNLAFYPVAAGSSGPIAAGAYVQVVITRDAGGTVTGYVNGVQQFSFADTSNLAVIDGSNALRFFRDDNAVPNEDSSGAVARIRIWDQALTAAEVAALEPPTADLAVSMSPSATLVAPGANVTYTITVTNNGPTNSTGYTLTDTLPANATFVSVTPSCALSAGVLTCAGSSLAAGQSATYTVVVNATTVGMLTNTGTVTGNETDLVAGNNSVTSIVTVALADLGVNVTPSATLIPANTNLTYTVTVTNNGPSTSTAYSLTDTLPANATLVSATGCVPSAGVVTCSGSNLGIGLSATYTIVVMPTAVGPLTNSVTVAGNEPDPVSANNSATSTSTIVAAVADVAVTMTASPSPVAVLGSVTYRITVTNNGPSTATGVVLTNTLPAGTLFASIDDTTHCALLNGVLTCNFGAVGAGGNNVVNLILIPLTVPTGAGTFDNTATVTANEPDPDLSNNSATGTVQVTGTDLPGGGAVRNLGGFSNTISMPNDDDSFGPVPMGFGINFFGSQVSSLFVNNNGNVTFGLPLGTYTPFSLTTTNLQIIAPYFSDVETYEPGSGLVTYGTDTVNGRPAFGVNWPNVTYCCGEGNANLVDLFQLVLVDRSDVNAGDFDIELNYDKIQWETGGASGGINGLGGNSARVGYSNGTGASGSFFELPGSAVPGSFLDSNAATGLIYNTLNSTQPGRYVFQIRNGAVQSSADLAITASAPQVAAPGGTVNYAITATNHGPNTATGVTVTNTLPVGMTFVSATPGTTCPTPPTPAPGQPVVVTCNLGSMASGATVNIAIQATIPTTLSGLLTDTAVISAPNFQDLNLGNNTATAGTNVSSSDIAVSAAAATSPVGGFPAYNATITNNGPSNATSVVATATLENFSYVNASANGAPCTFSAPLVSCNIGALANGASVVITVVVGAPNQGWAAISFHGTAAQPDPNPINNEVRLGPSLDSFNTPVGNNIFVSLSDSLDNITAALTFSSITRTGSTIVSPLSAASLPAGFRNGRQSTVFDISTNAEFTGAIGVNIHFAPSNFRHPALVRLFHFENGTWVDSTVSLNAASGVISGRVLSLSPFALLEPLDNIPVANAGGDRSVPGAMAAGARVTLDGSASTDADGDALTYRWSGPFPEGGGAVTGVNPTVTLPLGVSKVLLVVNDGEADSPAVAVNVAVADFQMMAPAASVALTRGQSTTFTISMVPQYGAFAAPVNLACSSASPNVTCSLSSASVTPGGSGTTAVLTVTAGSTIAGIPARSKPVQFALWFATLPVFGVVLVTAGRRRKWQMAVLLALVLVLVMAHVGCGGGGTKQTQSSSSPTTPGSQAVVVTVTGSSGTLQHSSAVTVTIPQ